MVFPNPLTESRKKSDRYATPDKRSNIIRKEVKIVFKVVENVDLKIDNG